MGRTRYHRRDDEDYAALVAYSRAVLDGTEHRDRRHERLRRDLLRALREDVTPRQQEYLAYYYGEGLTMAEIGARLGVHPTTVSRTIKRGEARLRRCLRYGAAALLEQTA